MGFKQFDYNVLPHISSTHSLSFFSSLVYVWVTSNGFSSVYCSFYDQSAINFICEFIFNIVILIKQFLFLEF